MQNHLLICDASIYCPSPNCVDRAALQQFSFTIFFFIFLFISVKLLWNNLHWIKCFRKTCDLSNAESLTTAAGRSEWFSLLFNIADYQCIIVMIDSSAADAQSCVFTQDFCTEQSDWDTAALLFMSKVGEWAILKPCFVRMMQKLLVIYQELPTNTLLS